jgi:uncharacterized protein
MTELVAPPSNPAPVPPPAARPERVVTLDVVRGLAVLGILVMNVVEFGQPLRAYENPAGGGGATGLDLLTFYVQAALFDGKMRALFSMLFGAGLVLLAQRMAQSGRGHEATDLLVRRCLWLVPLGIAHRFALQWTGDILYMYGLLGLIAVAFRKVRPWRQVVIGVLFLSAFVPIELWHHHQASTLRAQAAEADALSSSGQTVPDELRQAKTRWERRIAPPTPESAQGEIDAMRGGYRGVFAYRWDYHHNFQSTYVYSYFVWDVLGMMLLGMGLLGLGFFHGRWATSAYVAVIVAGVAVAAATLLWARSWAATGFSGGALELRALRGMTYAYARGVVGLAWAAALILLVRRGAWRWLTATLAAVGRMAFTNYVLQTVCCTLLFFGYGCGLYAELSRAQLMLVWVAVSLVQVGFTFAWLAMVRIGPLEWLWRSLTYWRMQPILRTTK